MASCWSGQLFSKDSSVVVENIILHGIIMVSADMYLNLLLLASPVREV